MNDEILRIMILSVVSFALAATGVVRRPGLGIILALIAIAYLTWSRDEGLSQFGFRNQDHWILTITLGLGIGAILGLFAMAVIEPLAERITGQPHDISIVEGTRGNFLTLLQWLIIVWLLVGFIEEFIFRGYLMTEFIRLTGNSFTTASVALVFSSIVFGLAHLYQGASGGISAAIMGFILGLIFLISEFNLWLLILVHGFIDTLQIILISLNKDSLIRHWFIPAG